MSKGMVRESLRYVTGESQESHPSTTREDYLGPIILWYTKPGALPRHDTSSTNTSLVVEHLSTGWNNCRPDQLETHVVDYPREHVGGYRESRLRVSQVRTVK